MLRIELQWGVEESPFPSSADCQKWVSSALIGDRAGKETEMSIRIVDEAESQALNQDFRNVNKPTNVLSFPFENPPGLADFGEILPYLGDLAICAEVVAREAEQQDKPLEMHWAHMIVHGTLHLQGFDHVDELEADAMEALEIQILKGLGFENPYQSQSGVESV